MNLKKLTATITAICFVYTGVVFPAVQAAVSPGMPGSSGFKETLNGLMIPATVGRITDAKYYGSRKVVVNIQDLHCHPEVQRNISKILGELDEKYQLKAVYLEGGYGDIDTSWLTGLKEESLRKGVAEAMVNEGRLTGAEYYSVIKNKPHLLKGIEDEEMHKGNIVRLGEMLGKKGEYGEKVKLLDRDLEFMEAKYFTSRNRRFNKIIEQFREGKLPAEKYYRLLGKYVYKINENPYSYNNVFTIDMNKYPNIKGYLELLEKGKRLDYKRISRQLQGFVRVLKEKLPYSAYNYLLEKTDNFSKLDKLYVALSKLRREYDFNLSKDYPDLEKFFAYVDKGQEVNPVGMIKEEKRLIEEIRIGFARDVSELEVSFAADFYGYFKDYLFGRLAADDYRYFTERIGKFKEIWGKYTYVSRLKDMEGEYGLLDEYYRVNAERNRVFLEKILAEGRNSGNNKGETQGIKEAAGVTEAKGQEVAGVKEITGKEDRVSEDIRKTIESLERSPEIVVVVTGGFHTEGLQALLGEKKVTYVSITPNVTQDTKTSSVVYEEFAKQQAKVLSYRREVPTSYLNIKGIFKTAKNTIRDTVKSYVQVDFKHSDALALTVASCQQGMERFKPAAEVLWKEAAKGSPAEIVAQLKELMAEMGIEGVEVAIDDRHITFKGKTEAKINRGTGKFEDSKEIGQKSARENIATIGKLTAQDAKLAADTTVFLAKWVALSGSLVGFGRLVTDILLAGAKWAGDQNLTVGEGLIYAIAQNEQLQGMIAKYEGISADELGKLDPMLQKIIVARAQRAKQAEGPKSVVQAVPGVSEIVSDITANMQKARVMESMEGTEVPFSPSEIMGSIRASHERLLKLGIDKIPPFALRSVSSKHYHPEDRADPFGANPQYSGQLFMIGINPEMFINKRIFNKGIVSEDDSREFLQMVQNTFVLMTFGNDMNGNYNDLQRSPVFIAFNDAAHGGIEFPNTNQQPEGKTSLINLNSVREALVEGYTDQYWYSKTGTSQDIPASAEAFSVKLTQEELDLLMKSLDAYVANDVKEYLGRQPNLRVDDEALAYYKRKMYGWYINYYLYAKFVRQLVLATENAVNGEKTSGLQQEPEKTSEKGQEASANGLKLNEAGKTIQRISELDDSNRALTLPFTYRLVGWVANLFRAKGTKLEDGWWQDAKEHKGLRRGAQLLASITEEPFSIALPWFLKAHPRSTQRTIGAIAMEVARIAGVVYVAAFHGSSWFLLGGIAVHLTYNIINMLFGLRQELTIDTQSESALPELPYDKLTRDNPELFAKMKDAAAELLKNRAKETITTEEFEEQINSVLKPLAEIKINPSPEKWNKATWQAYQNYVNSYKYSSDRPAVTGTDADREFLEKLASNNPLVNLQTLSLLIRRDQFLERVARQYLPLLGPDERMEYVTCIHNNGYFALQDAKTKDPNDVLLKVGEYGGFDYGEFEDQMVALLSLDAQKRYNDRFAKPGKTSMLKLTLADLADSADVNVNKQKVAQFIELYNKTAGKEYQKNVGYFLDLLEYRAVPGENRHENAEEYLKRLKNISIFNGFVRRWDLLVAEANEKFDAEGTKKQLDFIFGKQETALASAVAILSTPSIVDGFSLKDKALDAAQTSYDSVNQLTHADWIVTNPWTDWEGAPDSNLVTNGYNDGPSGIGRAQMEKDQPIWVSVLTVKKTGELMGMTDRDFEMFFGDLIRLMGKAYSKGEWTKEQFERYRMRVAAFVKRLSNDPGLVNDLVIQHLGTSAHAAYYNEQAARVNRLRDDKGNIDPFIGGTLSPEQEAMLADTPAVKAYFRIKAHENGRTVDGEQGLDNGEKVNLNLADVQRDKWLEFLNSGKKTGSTYTQADIDNLSPETNVLNSLVRPWEELMDAAHAYPQQMRVKQKFFLLKKQRQAVVNAIALFKIKSLMQLSGRDLDMFIYVMNRATNALWKTTAGDWDDSWSGPLIQKAFEVLEQEEGKDHQIFKDQVIWANILRHFVDGGEQFVELLVRDLGRERAVPILNELADRNASQQEMRHAIFAARRDKKYFGLRTETGEFTVTIRTQSGTRVTLTLDGAREGNELLPEYVGSTAMLYRIKEVKGSESYKPGDLFKLPKGASYAVDKTGRLQVLTHSPQRLERTRRSLSDYTRMQELFGVSTAPHDLIVNEIGQVVGMLQPFVRGVSGIELARSENELTEEDVRSIVQWYITGTQQTDEANGRKYGVLLELSPGSVIKRDGRLVSIDADVTLPFSTPRDRENYGFFTGGYGSAANWIVGSNEPLTREEVNNIWRGFAKDGRQPLTQAQLHYRDLFIKVLGETLRSADPTLPYFKGLNDEFKYISEAAGKTKAAKRAKKTGIKNIMMPVLVLLVLMGSLLFPNTALAAHGGPSTTGSVTLAGTAVKLATNEKSSQELLKELEALKSEFAQDPITSEVRQDANGILAFTDAEATKRAALLQEKALAIYAQMQKEGVHVDGDEYIDKERYGTEAYDVRKTLIVWAILSPDTFKTLADSNRPIYVDTMKDGETGGMGSDHDGEPRISINSKLYDNQECGYFIAARVISRAYAGIDHSFSAADKQFAEECGVDIPMQSTSSGWVYYVLAGAAVLAVARGAVSRMNKSRRSKTRAGSGRPGQGTARETNTRPVQEERSRAAGYDANETQYAIDRIRRLIENPGNLRNTEQARTAWAAFEDAMAENRTYNEVLSEVDRENDRGQYDFSDPDILGITLRILQRMQHNREKIALRSPIKEEIESLLKQKLLTYLSVRRERGESAENLIRDIRSQEYADLKRSLRGCAAYARDIFLGISRQITGLVKEFNDGIVGEDIKLTNEDYLSLVIQAIEDNWDLRTLRREVNKILGQHQGEQKKDRRSQRGGDDRNNAGQGSDPRTSELLGELKKSGDLLIQNALASSLKVAGQDLRQRIAVLMAGNFSRIPESERKDNKFISQIRRQAAKQLHPDQTDNDKRKTELLKEINNFCDICEELIKQYDRGNGNGGLIGKYVMLSKPEYNSQTREIRFKARHIETGDKEEIILSNVRTMDQNDIDKRIAEVGNNEIAQGIAFWFKVYYAGETFVFDENRYGIHGIGTSCIVDGVERSIVGVSGQYKDNKIAWFHEAAELMGVLGELDADAIVMRLQDRSWYDAHISKPGREGLKLHYAIRALQREVFAQDTEMTYEIKGRLSENELSSIIQSRGAPLGAVLIEFRSQRMDVKTREQEQALLDEIIRKESILAQERKEQARKEEEDRKRRAREEEVEKRSIEQCIQTAETILTPYQMEEALAELQKYDKKLVAEAVAAKLIQMPNTVNSKLRSDKRLLNTTLVNKVFPTLGPENIRYVLKTVLQVNVSPAYYGREEKNLAELLSSLIEVAVKRRSTSRHLNEFGKDLVPAFREIFSERASIEKYWVANVEDLEKYFDIDPHDQDKLYFKKDFLLLMDRSGIRDWGKKKQLLSAYTKATFKQAKLQEWIRLLLKNDAGGYLFDDFLNELESGASSGLARSEMISLLSSGWKGNTKEADRRLAQLVDILIGAYMDTKDPKLQETLMISLSHVADKVDSEAVRNRIFTFVAEHNPSLFDQVTKLGIELRDADRAYESLQKDSSAAKDQLGRAKDTVRKIERGQEDAMTAMRRRIAILSDIAKKAFETSGKGGVCDAVLRYLAEVASNDRWDVNITEEIMSAMKYFVQNQHPTAIEFVVNQTVSGMSGDTKKYITEIFSRTLSRSEVMGILMDKDPRMPDRLKYLLLLMHHKDKKLLMDIVKDNASAPIDTPLRIHAFNLLVTHHAAYKTRDRGGLETTGYDSDLVDKLTALLGKDVEKDGKVIQESAVTKYLRKATNDTENFKRLFEEIPLQHEEALVNHMAVLIFMQNKLHHLSGAGFTKISERIAGSEIRLYWNNADSGFSIGGRLMTTAKPGTYFLVVAHELMHNILSEGYDYSSSKGTTEGTVHELLADAYAEYFAGALGLDFDAYMNLLRYADHFEDVRGDEFFSIEVHEGARAQQMIIRETMKSRNIDFKVEKFIASAVKVIVDGEKENRLFGIKLDEMTAVILSYYFRADAKVSASGTGWLSAFAFGGDSYSDIDEPREEDHHQKILDFSGVSKIADQFFKALLPENAGRYFQRMLQGRTVESALWGVHLKELPLILFTPPAYFDQRHGEANAAREQVARAMQWSFRAAMLPGLVLTLGGIFGLVPAALMFGVLGAGMTAGITISGILHVRYDKNASIPMAFFVTQDPGALDAAQLDPKKRGYAPVVITSVSRLSGEVRNAGIKVQGQDVWTSVDERGVLTVYVAGENEEFVKNASEVISVLKGYGNLQGSSRVIRVLEKLENTKGQTLNASLVPVVFDYTNSVRLADELKDMPVLSGELAKAGYGAIMNVYNAEQWPREIAFEGAWSKEFLENTGDRFNNSLVLSMDKLNEVGLEVIQSLKRKGAKIYMRYEGDDSKELEKLKDKIQAYGMDGVICSKLSTNADELAQSLGKLGLWVAGPNMNIQGETAKKYLEIDLSRDKGKLRSIEPYTVVKVKLGEKYALEDILALNQLPATCIIVFDGAGFKSDTNQPSRDFTLLAKFGVNVLELLKIAPVSREEKEEYERRVAYRLVMGTFEVPGDLEGDIARILKGEFSGISGNVAFLEAVRLHMLGTRDEGLKGIFLNAVAERMRARARLAVLKPSKADGLADEELERLYGELLVREDGRVAAYSSILGDFATFAAAHTRAEVDVELAKTIAPLKAKKSESQAISTMIKLIELYAEEKVRMNASREDMKETDLRSIKNMLEAA